MVIPPIPPAYTRLLIKKSPTDMVISNFAKKSGGDKYTPPFTSAISTMSSWLTKKILH